MAAHKQKQSEARIDGGGDPIACRRIFLAKDADRIAQPKLGRALARVAIQSIINTAGGHDHGKPGARADAAQLHAIDIEGPSACGASLRDDKAPADALAAAIALGEGRRGYPGKNDRYRNGPKHFDTLFTLLAIGLIASVSIFTTPHRQEPRQSHTIEPTARDH